VWRCLLRLLVIAWLRVPLILIMDEQLLSDVELILATAGHK
jgi:hypothetical protein